MESPARDELCDRGIGLDETDNRDVVQLLVDQIEFANVIVINKADLVDDADVAYLEAILSKLNPKAQLIRATRGAVPLQAILNTGLFDMEEAESHPEWLAGEPGTHVPETEEYGISSVVFRARRPLHPQRYWDLITGPAFQGVIRSKGFVCLATRSDYAGVWSSAGSVSSLQYAGTWLATAEPEEWPEGLTMSDLEDIWEEPWGDRRQELVIIGARLAADLLDQLHACCLTDDEMDAGQEEWLDLPDPFPAWRISMDGDGESIGEETAEA